MFDLATTPLLSANYANSVTEEVSHPRNRINLVFEMTNRMRKNPDAAY